ncbi:MAG: AAA family ATPase [Gammaproteobacteria bacterium]|nr:AAA family ATPase [Gammaproteobacteria bacterium]
MNSIKIDNFRAIKQLELPLDPQLTILVGNNASGKTTILDALAVGLSPALSHFPEVKGINFHPDDLYRFGKNGNKKAPYMRIKLESDNGVVWDRTGRRDKTKRTAAEVPKTEGVRSLKNSLENIINGVQDNLPVTLPVIACYGTERRVLPIINPNNNRKTFTRFSALSGALQAGANFRAALEWMIAKENEEAREIKKHKNLSYKLPEAEAVRQAIEKAIPEISSLRTELLPPRLLVNFQFIAQSHDIEQLAVFCRA